MKNNKLLFFYFHLFAVLCLGSFAVGGITLRVISTTIMFLLLIRDKKFSCLKEICYLNFFILFLFIMYLSLSFNGELLEFSFFKKFFAFYFVGIVTFLSILRFVQDKVILKNTIFLLSVICFSDAVLTVLQFHNNNIGWNIGMLFGDISEFKDSLDVLDSSLGRSIVPGIFNGVVLNACRLAILLPLLYYIFSNSYSSLVKLLFGLSSIIVCYYAIYATQQRTAFGISILFLFVFLFRFIHKNIKYILLFIGLAFIILPVVIDMLEQVDLGRLTKRDNEDRYVLHAIAQAYILDNWLIGGPVKFQKVTGVSAHNLFYDALIFSGLFGFISLMLFHINIAILSFKNIMLSYYNQRSSLFYLSFSMLIGLVYGCFHNTSFLTGEVLFFIIFALMLKEKSWIKKS